MVQTTPTNPAALARRPDPAGPLAVATPTTRKLADASLSVNTRRAYAGALRRLDAWRAAAPVDDASLAVYLGELFEAGRSPATAALAVAAVRFRATLAGQPAPAGEATARVLGGYRRTAADRGRGQAAPLRADGLAAILATAERPRTDGRGVESPTTAHRRGRLAKPRHSGINATVTPRSHHGLRLTVGELLEAFYRGGGKVRRSGERPGDWELIRRACRWISGAAAGVADPDRRRTPGRKEVGAD